MALIVSLLGGSIILFQTEALWSMDSPNAISWNATLNTSATGFQVIPIFIVVIILAIGIGILATVRGYN